MSTVTPFAPEGHWGRRTISGRSKPVEGIIMAAQEIPLVGQPKLLNRVEVAEGTNGLPTLRNRRDLISSPDKPLT